MTAIKSRTVKAGEIHLTKEERQYSESLSGRAPKVYRIERLTQRALNWQHGGYDGLSEDRRRAVGFYPNRGAMQDGIRSFKLVGDGSYQHAALYVTTESEGRERFRGTCQCCGGSQVVQGKVVVLHGYTRPGDGQVFGRCSGTDEQPAEFDLTITHAILKSLQAQLEAASNALDMARVDLDNFHAVASGNWNELELKTYREIENRRNDARRNQSAAESYITFLTTFVVPKFGKELTREVV